MGEKLFEKLKTLESSVKKEHYFRKGEWDVDSLKEDYKSVVDEQDDGKETEEDKVVKKEAPSENKTTNPSPEGQQSATVKQETVKQQAQTTEGQKTAAQATASPAAASGSTEDDLPLPTGWRKVWSKTKNKFYFVNTADNKALWRHPSLKKKSRNKKKKKPKVNQ